MEEASRHEVETQMELKASADASPAPSLNFTPACAKSASSVAST